MSDDIVERLRAWTGDQEPVMKQWDAWRSYIARGGGGSWPRDAFESLLDSFAEDANEASAAIERLTIERDRYASDAATTRAEVLDWEGARKQLRQIARDCHRRMRDSGESYEMCARWICEAFDRALAGEKPDPTLFGKYSRSK